MLTDKQRKTYFYASRYQNTDYYYDTLDQKYWMGLSQWLRNDTPYIKYTVEQGDTYDSIALAMYNNPTYWWVITDFNRILDPFETPVKGTVIKVPIFSNIEFKEN